MLFMCHVCLYYAALPVPFNPVITCQERADDLALMCVTFSSVFVTFPHGVSGQV